MNEEKQKQIEDFIDLMFNFDFKELENEKTILEFLDKLRKENKQLKAELELYKDNEEYLNNKIDKALKMVSNEKYLHIERLEKIKDILWGKE